MIRVQNKREFSKQLKELAKKLDISLTTALQKVAVEMYRGVTEKTPVDTGYARASWNLGVDRVKRDVPDEKKWKGKKKRKSSTLAPGEPPAATKQRENQQINAALKNRGPNKRYFITNNVPYIVFLEEGTETYQGRHMVERTIAEAQAKIAKILEEVKKSI